MRLFAAFPVGEDALSDLTGKLRRFRAAGLPVKWASDEALHVTVKFLGEVSPGRLPEVRTGIDAAVRGTPLLHFTPGELGAFPTLPRARVLWAGYEAEAALELLVHRVEQHMELLGFPGEGRPFRAHVTLGRVRDGARLPPDCLPMFEQEPLRGEFSADRLILYESRLGPGGAKHLELDSFSLGT
jgi:RNA 2',3'-cyclic 3'-phosphodiesterase